LLIYTISNDVSFLFIIRSISAFQLRAPLQKKE
jgi:hypothetical protein